MTDQDHSAVAVTHCRAQTEFIFTDILGVPSSALYASSLLERFRACFVLDCGAALRGGGDGISCAASSAASICLRIAPQVHPAAVGAHMEFLTP